MAFSRSGVACATGSPHAQPGRADGQAFGADLNCSELRHWRSAPNAVQPYEEYYITMVDEPSAPSADRLGRGSGSLPLSLLTIGPKCDAGNDFLWKVYYGMGACPAAATGRPAAGRARKECDWGDL